MFQGKPAPRASTGAYIFDGDTGLEQSTTATSILSSSGTRAISASRQASLDANAAGASNESPLYHKTKNNPWRAPCAFMYAGRLLPPASLDPTSIDHAGTRA